MLDYPFTYVITASEMPTSYGAIGLPPGLALDTATGLISGSPTVAGSFTVTLSATNSCGTNSRVLKLILKNPPAAAVTTPASEIASSTARLNASIHGKGQPTEVHFEYGPTTAYGTVTATQNLQEVTRATPASTVVTGLLPNTTYHYRAVANNGSGRIAAKDQAFTTLSEKPDQNATKPAAEQSPPFAGTVQISPPTAGVGVQKSQQKKRGFRINWLLLFTVIIPTILSGAYFGLIASDIYNSESRFIVRSPRDAGAGLSALGSLLSTQPASASQAGTYSVRDFISSRNAMQELHRELDLVRAFGRRDVDFVSRFGGLTQWDLSHEALRLYYQKRVKVDLETTSNILALKVSAFTAEDAFRINEILLNLAETYVNRLSEREIKDTMRLASEQLALASNKSKESALALASYRKNSQLVDPVTQSHAQLSLISALHSTLIESENLLSLSQTFSPENPQIPFLKKRIEALKADISAETAKLTAADAASLVSKTPEYSRLALESDFADRNLAATLGSYETALADARNNRLYVVRVVQPGKPDVAQEPQRIRNVFATFVIGLVLWGISSLLIAGVREHRD
jgi:capsular polysaccharide transport system permease protein